MSTDEKFDADYFLRGEELGISNYSNYRFLPELSYSLAGALKRFLNIEGKEIFRDYGCSRGYLIKALRDLGVNAYGTDISKWAVENCHPDVKDYVYLKTGRVVFSQDHFYSKDVLEHLTDDELKEVLENAFAYTHKSILLIFPLCETDGGEYIYPNDEKDKTHIQRRTLVSWLDLIHQYSNGFAVLSELRGIPIFKMCAKDYPGSTGFVYCKKI
jgi:hypothetical protein